MITENTKTIFNNASKKTGAFVREAISVFPKIKIVKNSPNIKITKLLKNKKEKY